MWFLKSLADFFLWLFRTLWDLAGDVEQIWSIGGTLAEWVKDIASGVLDAEGYVRELDKWADDLMAQIRDFLSWDSIKAKIEDWLPFVAWTAGDWVDFLWWRWLWAFEDWLETRLNWVWDIGYKVLNKLL